MNETIQLLNNHTSIRKFNSEIITEEEKQAIINCAMRGATAGNMMLYSIIKIQNEDTLEKLSISCDNQPFIKNCSFALLFVVDTTKFYKLFENRGIPEKFPNYKANSYADFILGTQDCVIAAQNSVIAAESLGIGTCYIGDIVEHFKLHRELFNLPKGVMPLSLLVFGRYDTKPTLKRRFNYDSVVFDETYPTTDEAFINNMFADLEENNPNFAEKFYKRKINADFYNEMNNSIMKYLKFWS